VPGCQSAEVRHKLDHFQINKVWDRHPSRIRSFTLTSRGGGQGDVDNIQEKINQGQKRQRYILGGSLQDALQEARSKARLLIVFLPAMVGSSTRNIPTFNEMALTSLLSDAVYNVTERTFRTNKKSSTSSSSSFGSFLTWSSLQGSYNYNAAVSMIKKLKGISPLGSKSSPYLVVLYPSQVLDSTGKPKVIPKLLVQHHCNPPPGEEAMASWLLSLRNRHKKMYASMHRDLAEMEFLRERISGYSESLKENKAIEDREKQQEETRREMERKEKEHLERIRARRKELVSSLPPEPALGDERNVITIALRFQDGRSGRRRFMPDTLIHVVFDWVDAMFDIEREKVELSTMTGQQTFTLSTTSADVTLEDVGLGKLTGLRVTELKTNPCEEDAVCNDTADDDEQVYDDKS